MGASESKQNERYNSMMQNALEKQRKEYEEKCKQLLEEQKKIRIINERVIIRNTKMVSDDQPNRAPLYPNLQQVSSINMQPTTSSAYNHAQSSTLNQNKSIVLQPSVPTAPAATTARSNQQNQRMSTVSATSLGSYNTRNSDTVNRNEPRSIDSFDIQPSAPTAPTATTARPNKQNHRENKKNHDLYLCPSCKVNDLVNNIFQCRQGHSSCDQCKIDGIKCGICKSPITNTRNIELERVVANLTGNNLNTERVECPNRSDGCSLSFTPANLPKHLKECVFREMECPIAFAKYSDCFWRGKINQIEAHFLEYHPDQTGANVDTEMCFDKATTNHVIHHISMGNFHFLVHVKLDSGLQMFFMTVQFLGSRVSATKWSYEFHVYDKSDPRRKYTYGDVCLPTTVQFSDVSNQAKCASLPLEYALSFFKNNKVTYKFYIKRDESKKGRNNIKTRSVPSET